MIVLNVSAVSPLSRRSGVCRRWGLVGALLASAWLSAATSNGQSSSPVPDAPSEQADQPTWALGRVRRRPIWRNGEELTQGILAVSPIIAGRAIVIEASPWFTS